MKTTRIEDALLKHSLFLETQGLFNSSFMLVVELLREQNLVSGPVVSELKKSETRLIRRRP